MALICHLQKVPSATITTVENLLYINKENTAASQTGISSSEKWQWRYDLIMKLIIKNLYT